MTLAYWSETTVELYPEKEISVYCMGMFYNLKTWDFLNDTLKHSVSRIKKNGFQLVFLSWRGVWRIDSSRGLGTGRRRPPMEKEQGSVASSASVTIPSTTSASTGSNTISNSSSRQQAVPQISVYGGITDRQTVQVQRNQSQSVYCDCKSFKFALSSGAIYRPCAATTSIINEHEGLIHR